MLGMLAVAVHGRVGGGSLSTDPLPDLDAEVQVLFDLYSSTGGDGWLVGWNTSDVSNSCSWHGVTCINGCVWCGLAGLLS